MRRKQVILGGCGLLLLAAAASAAFVNPFVPPFRGAPLAEYAGWEDFGSPYNGSNAPDDPATTAGSFGLVQTAFGGILTSGTIYNPSNPCVFDLSHAPDASIAAPDLQQLVVQVKTFGNELDLGTVKLRYQGPGGLVTIPAQTYTELYRLSLGAGLGSEVEHLFQWDLSGLADVIPEYVVRFKAQLPHMGLDTLTVDAQWASLAASYCTAGVSTSGCQAQLSATGSPSASAASGFVLQASGVEGNKDGLFFFGTNGRQAAPWGNGTSYQCVVPPVKRAGLLSGTGTNGACDGSFSQDLNALWASQPAKNPGSGAVVQAQLWYRDPLNTSNQTTGLSSALEFTVAP